MCSLLMTSKECLLWRWGASSAVRTTLPIGAADTVVVCNGAAYVAQFSIDGREEHTLKVLPVTCERRALYRTAKGAGVCGAARPRPGRQ